MADSIELVRDSAHPSLAGTGTLYACGQVRLTGATSVRYQCAGAEWSYNITPDIAKWLAAQPAPWASAAGSNAKYTPCLLRPESPDNAQMRVQVPGTEFNRPWGAEFIHNGPCSPAAVAVIGSAALGQPDEGEPDDQDIISDPTPEGEAEADADEEDGGEDDEDDDGANNQGDDKVPF